MAGKYGGEGKTFPSFVDGGKKLYWEVDSETGVAELYERKSPIGSLGVFPIKLGTKKPGEDFEVHDPPFGQNGFFEVFNEQQRKEFLSDANQKKLKDQLRTTTVNGNKAANPDMPDLDAQKRSDDLLETGKVTVPPDQSDEEAAVDAAQRGLDKVNKEAEELINSEVAQARTSTRKGAGSFGDHSYPLDRNQSQDFMKFTLLEYKPKKVGGGASGGGFGFSDRARVGPGLKGQQSGRTILGSVSLPIPGGIKDENGCDWAGKTMDEVQIQTGALARAFVGASDEDPGSAADAIVGRLGGNSDVVKKAIQETFAAKAVGVEVKNLMTRATGLIFNPNLELLFDKPTLRGFQFSFDLIPRSRKEAEEVIKIIRFFKQGMAAIRSESNLFLLSPNVFQVHYVLNGDGNTDHPYIGKMKECAMTNFNVDYTPQANYSTLQDGFMTAYKISMQMKELEPVYNDDYDDEQSSGTKGVPAEIGF